MMNMWYLIFKLKGKRQEEQRESQNIKCTKLREERKTYNHTDNSNKENIT